METLNVTASMVRSVSRGGGHVELGVVPKHAVLVERKAPLGFEVRGDPRKCRNSVSKRENQGRGLYSTRKALRKCIGEAFCELEEGQVGVRERLSHQPGSPASLEHALEVGKEARQALVEEVLRRFECCLFLILVVQHAADRMMGVVRLVSDVSNRELKLKGVHAFAFTVWGQAVSLAEIGTNHCRLGQNEIPVD